MGVAPARTQAGHAIAGARAQGCAPGARVYASPMPDSRTRQARVARYARVRRVRHAPGTRGWHTHTRDTRYAHDTSAGNAHTRTHRRASPFATKAKQPLSPRFRLARVLTRPSRRSSFLRDSERFAGHLARRSARLARHTRHARATHARDPFAVCVGIPCRPCNFFQTLSAQSFAPRFSPFCSLFGVGFRYTRQDREGRVFRPESASFRLSLRRGTRFARSSASVEPRASLQATL